MPEPPAWRFQKIIKPMFDLPVGHSILKGRVLTCKGNEVIEKGFVEIENERIKAVGLVSDLGNSDALEVETGGTILPGMFNNHAHLSWDGIHDLAQQSMFDSVEISAYKSAGNMLISLRSGITTVRDLGMNKTNFAAKQAVEQGIFPGPRMLITGEAIVQTGGHTYWCCREASGADEMRRAVREQVRGGADLIKIMANHDRLEFTDAELEAVIDEAHRNGLPVTAHATDNDAIDRVVRFGINVIEHGGKMTDETIRILVDRKIPIVTTFSAMVMQANAEVARKYNIPEWKIQERQKALSDPKRYDSLVQAAKAGVRIAFGTDAGSPVVPHSVVVPEMKYMVQIGVVEGNYGAIHSATTVGAWMNKLDQKLGSLEAGKLADVVVVEGDPTVDLEALNHVQMTFLAGKRMI
jgi:imidazolonepropionase-like amidohydrolase